MTIITIVLFFIFVVNGWTVPLRHVLFELETELIGNSGMPKQNWVTEINDHPDRDSSTPGVKIEKLSTIDCVNGYPTLNRIFKIYSSTDQELNSLLKVIQGTQGVVWVELSPIGYTCGLTKYPNPGIDAPVNDPYYALQWSLHKVYSDAAWDISRGDTSVTIAIVDIGVDIDHDDLIHSRWVNWREYNGVEGTDDDENGFVDDIHGWDFYENDPDPRPGGGDVHGTHVAGIAAAGTDNGYGIAGVGWNCRIMAIRAGSNRTISYGYEGLIYAAASGADIINLSWGSNSPSNIERITIDFACQQGALVVAAAGNLDSGEASFDHFPAKYDQVLSVAAVDTADILAHTSNFGSWIDVSAPGIKILSTIPNGFGILTGTSMASPLVAGAAGLLKALHPDWNAAQLKKQIMLSCDPVDDINPTYRDSMGAGRLNLYRMLADDLVGLSVVSVEISEFRDSDFDGIIEQNEEIKIEIEIENLLMESTTARVVLDSEDQFIRLFETEFEVAEIAPGQRINNADNPFTAKISRNSQTGRIIPCKLTAYLPGGEINFIHEFQIVVKPQYVTHNNGNIAITATNFGALGYFDYLREEGVGEGFRYPRDGLTGLFHGTLMIGIEPGLVSDCAFGDSGSVRFDFVTLNSEFRLETNPDGSMESAAIFEDSRSTLPIGVSVDQRIITYPNDPDDDYAIIQYNITNNSGIDLGNLHVGLYLDWDIVQPNYNSCLWDGEELIGWIEHSGGAFPFFGSAMLEAEPTFHVAISNADEWPRELWNRWSDRAKFDLMKSGFSNAEGAEPKDYSQLIGIEGIDLNENQDTTLTFVVLAGFDLEDFMSNYQAARAKYQDQAFGYFEPEFPGKIELLSVYPQPFNGLVKLSFSIPESGLSTWHVFDSNGRQLLEGYQYFSKYNESMMLDFTNFASGRYLVSINQGGQTLNVPLVLLR